jgi:hypothetical protein
VIGRWRLGLGREPGNDVIDRVVEADEAVVHELEPHFRDARAQRCAEHVIDFRAVLAQRLITERGDKLAGALPSTASSVGSFMSSNTNYLALGLLIQTLRHDPSSKPYVRRTLTRSA